MKALIVNRSRLQQTLISKYFSSQGIIVSIVSNYDEAIKILMVERIDIVCTSYQINNEITGFELAEEIRRRHSLDHIYIVLLTTTTRSFSDDDALNTGINQIIDQKDIPSFDTKLAPIIKSKKQEFSTSILYIEDSKVAATMTMNNLKDSNVKFDHYLTAEEGLKAYKQQHNKYDLIITDLILDGDMSGEDFIKKIRIITPDSYKMPILAVSGIKETENRVKLLGIGANDYIVKPYVKEELLHRVNYLITTKQLFDQVAYQQTQLYNQLEKDPLTGLYNRNSMKSLIPKFNSSIKRNKKAAGVLLFDINNFKDINKKYGEIIGDEILSSIGNEVSNSFRTNDLCFRYGNDEFVIILYNASYDDTVMISQKFKKKIEDIIFHETKLKFSMGVIATNKITDDLDISLLLNKIDKIFNDTKKIEDDCFCSIDLTKK